MLTYGHRNVQGLAQRRDGSLWSVEHGPDRDDEVNRLRKGGDYGWHPVPGYAESVPMTDHSLSGRQVAARWRSGEPTLATSGAVWVYGEDWGRLRGTLAVAAFKAERVVFMKFSPKGTLRWTRAPRALRGLDRLRSVELTPGGSLLVTTDRTAGRTGCCASVHAAEGHGRHSKTAAPPVTVPNHTRASTTGSHGSRVGWGVHQRVASTRVAAQTTNSASTTYHGVVSRLAPIRKHTQAMPIMPTNGHGDTRAGRGGPGMPVTAQSSASSSFQFGSLSHSSLRSSTLSSARAASACVG